MTQEAIKILIVDDDDLTRLMYAEVFRKNGFSVTEAKDGLEGLDAATKNPPAIIFTGIIMPRMDGFGLMEALKKNVVTSRIPVVFSSHLGREEDQVKAQDLGVKDFIIKGLYTPNEVVEKIKAIINLTDYNLKIVPGEMDAAKLAEDMHFSRDFVCSSCGGPLALRLHPTNIKDHEFSAKFFCTQCGKEQD